MRTTTILAALALLVATASASEPDLPPGPVSGEALHFRLEVGVEPGQVIPGWIDESAGTGKGYDTVVLDLDRDGTPEAVTKFTKSVVAGRERWNTKVPFQHAGGDWFVEFSSITYRRPVAKSGAVSTHLRWGLTQEGRYCWFINGNIVLNTDPAKAAEAAPIRLGPPFRFDVGPGARGADTLVRIGLKDAQRSTLRLSRQDGKMIQPELVLMQGEKEVFRAVAKYG